MVRLGSYCASVAGIALLAIAGAPGNADKDDQPHTRRPTPVQIVNPLPVPITGTLGLSGTANVNVANTPNVAVTNMPTVSLAAGSTIQVGNPASTPVLTRDVDNAARRAVTFHEEISLSPGSLGDSNVSTGFAVPAGKRLVLEYVSGFAFLQPNQRPLVTLFTSFQNSGAFHALPAVSGGEFSAFAFPETFTVNQSLRLYSDGPFRVGLQFNRNDSAGFALLQLTFSGYLIDL